MSFGALSFLSPLALYGLLALPLIWLVLRLMPPTPRDQVFPPLRLLYGIDQDEETPNAVPPWVLLYRLLLGGVLALALAGPVLFKPQSKASPRPLVLMIENGWASAGHWHNMIEQADHLAQEAAQNRQDIALLVSNPSRTITSDQTPKTSPFMAASVVQKRLKSLRPVPFETDRAFLAKSAQALSDQKTHMVWFHDGLSNTSQDGAAAQLIKQSLQSTSEHLVFAPPSQNAPVWSGQISENPNGLSADWYRVDTTLPREYVMKALAQNGQVIGQADVKFMIGKQKANARLNLPSGLRQKIAQIRLASIRSAGAVHLLDDQFGRPLVGLLKGADENQQPLLSEWHYIEKALSPNADLYKGDLEQILAVSPSIVIMTDRARTDDPRLVKYIQDGGFLIRFGGPKLAARPDGLLPVALRVGGRALGGALAWEAPQSLAPFTADSPFFGLDVREDIRIKKQIMAQAGVETDNHTWARLADGSPVITSAPFGAGRIVMFHVSAGPDWSSLPLSGLYVDLLKRLLPLARNSAVLNIATSNEQDETSNASAQNIWTAEHILDGYGRLSAPPIQAPTWNLNASSTGETPYPGLYKQGLRRKALNSIADPENYRAVPISGLELGQYTDQKPRNLSGILLFIVGLMLIGDVLMSLWASGRLQNVMPRLRAIFSVFVMTVVFGGLMQSGVPSASAQSAEQQDALALNLAYIITGDTSVDKFSKLGLEGLRTELTRRTTIEPAAVRAIDLDVDLLDFYPFLYWPVLDDAKSLSPKISAKVNEYMASGGTIVFDTQDYGRRELMGNQSHAGLKAISKTLDIPRLINPSEDHVLTKSFYLIQDYAGRWAGGKIWVESANTALARDGVSSVIVGSNDWVSAWAKSEEGYALAVIENDIPRQREFAIRFGVNLAMYTLSGNYKADQVHVATLIERLGESEDNIVVSDVPKKQGP